MIFIIFFKKSINFELKINNSKEILKKKFNFYEEKNNQIFIFNKKSEQIQFGTVGSYVKMTFLCSDLEEVMRMLVPLAYEKLIRDRNVWKLDKRIYVLPTLAEVGTLK